MEIKLIVCSFIQTNIDNIWQKVKTEILGDGKWEILN
jgi:hypothetical protein